MSQSETVQPYGDPEAIPVGPSGTRVVIRERKALAINGWLGVLVIAACIAATVLLLQHHSVRGFAAVPIVVGVVILASLVIVQPGQTRVVRFFGRYVGTVREAGSTEIMPTANGAPTNRLKP